MRKTPAKLTSGPSTSKIQTSIFGVAPKPASKAKPVDPVAAQLNAFGGSLAPKPQKPASGQPRTKRAPTSMTAQQQMDALNAMNGPIAPSATRKVPKPATVTDVLTGKAPASKIVTPSWSQVMGERGVVTYEETPGMVNPQMTATALKRRQKGTVEHAMAQFDKMGLEPEVRDLAKSYVYSRVNPIGGSQVTGRTGDVAMKEFMTAYESGDLSTINQQVRAYQRRRDAVQNASTSTPTPFEAFKEEFNAGLVRGQEQFENVLGGNWAERVAANEKANPAARALARLWSGAVTGVGQTLQMPADALGDGMIASGQFDGATADDRVGAGLNVLAKGLGIAGAAMGVGAGAQMVAQGGAANISKGLARIAYELGPVQNPFKTPKALQSAAERTAGLMKAGRIDKAELEAVGDMLGSQSAFKTPEAKKLIGSYAQGVMRAAKTAGAPITQAEAVAAGRIAYGMHQTSKSVDGKKMLETLAFEGKKSLEEAGNTQAAAQTAPKYEPSWMNLVEPKAAKVEVNPSAKAMPDRRGRNVDRIPTHLRIREPYRGGIIDHTRELSEGGFEVSVRMPDGTMHEFLDRATPNAKPPTPQPKPKPKAAKVEAPEPKSKKAKNQIGGVTEKGPRHYEQMSDLDVVRGLKANPNDPGVVREAVKRSKGAGFRSPTSWEQSVWKAKDEADAIAKQPQPKPVETPKAEVKQKEPWEMTRKEFKGEPKLYTGSKLHKNETAKKIYESTKPMPHEPFMDGLTIQKGPHQFVVFDGNTPVATYSSGDNLVVNPKYRRRGIGQTLLEQYKAERDAVPRALSRSKEADRLYDKVHNKFVKQALAEGKPVPAEVLADYPDLKPKAEAPKPEPKAETELNAPRLTLQELGKAARQNTALDNPKNRVQFVNVKGEKVVGTSREYLDDLHAQRYEPVAKEIEDRDAYWKAKEELDSMSGGLQKGNMTMAERDAEKARLKAIIDNPPTKTVYRAIGKNTEVGLKQFEYEYLKSKNQIPDAGKKVEGAKVKPDKDGNTWKVERESASRYLVHRYRDGELAQTTRLYSEDADVLMEGGSAMTPTGYTVGDNRLIRFTQMGKEEQSAWVAKIKKARANKSKTPMWLDGDYDVQTGFNPNNNQNRYARWEPLNEAARVAQEKLKRFDPTPRWERTPKDIQGKSIYLYARSSQGKMSQPLAGPFHTQQEAAAAAREVNARIRKDFDQNSQYALDGLSYGAVDPSTAVTVRYPDLRSDGPSPFQLNQLESLKPTVTKGQYRWDDKQKKGIVTLLKQSDVTTVIHETAHHHLKYLPDVQFRAVAKLAGAKSNEFEKLDEEDFVNVQEFYARAVEDALFKGKMSFGDKHADIAVRTLSKRFREMYPQGVPAPEKWNPKRAKGRLNQLTDAQRKQTQTPEFKKWFGDSKVVDENGEPLVVYHGTPRGGFDEFKKSERGASGTAASKKAFFFTDNPDTAKSYSGGVMSNASIYPVYLRANRLMTVDLKGQYWWNTHNVRRDAIQRAIRQGKDGVRFINGNDMGEGVTFAILEPTQIKSAIGNKGTFDPNDPSILNQNQGPSGWQAPDEFHDMFAQMLAGTGKAEREIPKVKVSNSPPLEKGPKVKVATEGTRPASFMSHAQDAAIRDAIGADAYERVTRKDKTVVAAAKGERGKAAEHMATAASGKPLSDVQQVALALDIEDALKQRHALLTAQKGKVSPADMAALSEVERKLTDGLNALAMAGSEAGRALRIRQLTMGGDYSEMGITQAYVKATGKVPTPETAVKIKELTARIEELEAKLAARRKASLPKYQKAVDYFTKKQTETVNQKGRPTLNQLSAEERGHVNAIINHHYEEGLRGKELIDKVEDITGVKRSDVATQVKRTTSAKRGKLTDPDERAQLYREQSELAELLDRETRKAVWQESGWAAKTKIGLKETRDSITSLVSSTDFSGSRQALYGMLANPKAGVKAFMSQFRAAFSEKQYDKILSGMQAEARYWEALDNGVELMGKPNFKEEQFRGRAIEKVPGAGVLVKGSDRAYSILSTQVRYEVYKSLTKHAKTPQDLKLAAEVANIMTGRAGSGKAKSLLVNEVGRTLLWAPSFTASRLQMPLLWARVIGSKASPRVKMAALRQYGQAVAILGGIGYAVASRTGGEFVTDKDSNDFGLVILPNGDKYDAWGGSKQAVRLYLDMLNPKRDGSYFNSQEDIVSRASKFAQGKLNPSMSIGLGLAQREDAIGQGFGVRDAAKRMLPLGVTMVGEDVAGGRFQDEQMLATLGAIGNMFGLFDIREKKPKPHYAQGRARAERYQKMPFLKYVAESARGK